MNCNNNPFESQDVKNFSKFLSNLSPIEFTSYGCLVGILLAAVLNSNEQNSIGNFLELVGQVILTAQAQSSYNTPNSPTCEEFNNFKQETKTNFENILRKIKNIKV